MQQLLPGTEVQARGLRWEVVSNENLGQQMMYRLRGLENAVHGQEVDLLYPFELIEPIRHDIDPTKAAPLVNWLVYHQAFLLEQSLGPNALLAAQPGRLRLEPYQLVPVLRAIRMSRVRLLLADGVGLGKTIQAGLVITELVARRLAHRILIVSPAGPLLEQWQMEMSQRFGLRLEVINRAKLQEVRRQNELGANPFDHIPLGLVSIDFLKQERVLELLERASYDVVVIDEAHHCMDIGKTQDREDSQRRRLAEVLARRCDSLVLLTATPHDGHDRSFASLCELLDPSLVDGRGSLREHRYEEHVVRRLKKHIFRTDPETGKQVPFFKERIVEPIAVVPDESKHQDFIGLQRGMLELIAPELRRAFRNKNYSDVLAYIALLKRSVSTAAACRNTLSVVADRFQNLLHERVDEQEMRRERIKTLREYNRKIERFGTITAEEENEKAILEAEQLAQQLASLQRETRRESRKVSKTSNVLEQLDELIQLATAASDADPKLDQLLETVLAIRKKEPKANILIYTEYVDSQNAVVEHLSEQKKIGKIITMSGAHNEATRAATTERFRTTENLILVSTDSAAEGLNLHQRCHHLIHVELPFNPNRLEQRNGRIDRYGQEFEPMVRYMYLKGTFEERILLRLIAKYEKQRSRLTFVPNTLGITSSTDASQERLLKSIMDDDTKLFKEESTLVDLTEDENEGADEATTELLQEIDRSLKGFESAAKTNAWLGDKGMSADEKWVRQASEAREKGKSSESVDLARFVTDAIMLDGGTVDGQITDEVFTVRIPPQWLFGLNDLPGFDAEKRLVRLTTDIEITQDKKDNPVGLLGRAHPLVRRAIDRVRNLSFGDTSGSGQDPRASAVEARIHKPLLLYTFIGRVSSGVGRELEQVLAVSVDAKGNTNTYETAKSWSRFAHKDRAINTRDVWKNHFADFDRPLEFASEIITESFAPIAEQFSRKLTEQLGRERNDLDKWLAQRVADITGTSVTPQEKQRELGFGDSQQVDKVAESLGAWLVMADPADRLAAFASDRSQTPRKRSEADGVLRLYQSRVADLETRSKLGDPEVIPIGVLMMVPEGDK